MERSFGSKYGKWIALTAVVLALVLWFVLSGGVENYRAKYEGYDLSQQIGDIGRSSTYSLYLRAHEGAPDASSDVSIPLVTVDSDGVTAQKDGLLMQSGSSATFAVTVPETGFYNIRLTYRTEAARGVDLERELRINGEVPFDGADTLTFTRLWHDGGEVRQDSQGNDIRPTQVEVFGEQTACCRDAMGYITEPYRFYFEAGESTVTLIATSEPMLLTALSLTAPEKMPDYAAYAAAQPQENSVPADFALVLEGESSTLRSSPSLYARYDRSSPATSPCDVRRTVLNYIGGDAWRDAGQWIEWDFDVPESGWYNITIKGRQTYNRGSVSSRILYIARPIATAVKIAAISRAVPGTERKRTSANVPATASPVPMLPLTIIITSATDIGRSASVSAKDAVCLQPRVNTSAVKMPSTSADARHSSSAETVNGVGRIEVSSESRRMFNFSFVVPFVRHRANIRLSARKVVQIACAVLGERRHVDFVSAQ